jgi:hypothetical protein
MTQKNENQLNLTNLNKLEFTFPIYIYIYIYIYFSTLYCQKHDDFNMFEVHCSYISKLKLKNIALDGIGFFSNFFLLLPG